MLYSHLFQKLNLIENCEFDNLINILTPCYQLYQKFKRMESLYLLFSFF
jgi:hypothetical protein